MNLVAQNSPVTTLGTSSTFKTNVIVPVTVDGFNDISSCALKIIYDPAVATPIGITTGPRLGGTANFNLTVPGEIRIGWYASRVVSLNSGDTIFNITFNKVSDEKTNLGFDDESNGRGCQYTTVVDGISQKLNDLPLSTYYIPGALTFINESPVTIAPMLTASVNDNIDIPVKVKDFKKVGVVSLTLNYDPAVLSFNSASNTESGFPNLTFNGDKPGTVIIGGSTTNINGVSLPDDFILFTLNFKYLGGTSVLSWNNDFSTSCEYGGTFPDYNILNDEPFTKYYINGLIEPLQMPLSPAILLETVTNPATCGGNGIIPLTFTNVPDGTYNINYNGGSFPNIAVSASAAAISAPAGIYNDLQITVNGETSVLGVNVVLTDPESPVQPVITAGGPTSFCEGGSVVLTSGEALTYQWSTGETTQSITVSASGNYSVTVSNASGCSATSEVTVVTVNARPEKPETVNCWDEFIFNTNTCTWEIAGVKPAKPAMVNCWDEFQFNETLCAWENKGKEPVKPEKANCWDEFVFNANTCSWENTGTKPTEPSAINCWDVFSFNTISCEWENTGVKPEKPAMVNCWDDFHFNETLCAWENKGTEPVRPEIVNCWDEFVFNKITCFWDNLGTKPVEPTTVNCWDEFTFNTNNCNWENIGVEPEKPATVNCWDDFSFNTNSCNWENIGVEPEKPEMVNCWDYYQFVEANCAWENKGRKPVEPTPLKSWDEFIFNPVSCTWENIGVATGANIYGHTIEMTLTSYPNPFSEKATIKYLLPENGLVNMEATGILGKRIILLSNQFQPAGEYLLDLEGEKLVSGIYQITLKLTGVNGGAWSKTIRMIKQ